MDKKKDTTDYIYHKMTEKKELTEKQKEDNFLDYLGLSRDDLSDDGSDLEELKELGGFNDWSNNHNWNNLYNNNNLKLMTTIQLSLIILNVFIYSYLILQIIKLWLNY